MVRMRILNLKRVICPQSSKVGTVAHSGLKSLVVLVSRGTQETVLAHVHPMPLLYCTKPWSIILFTVLQLMPHALWIISAARD